VFNLAKTLIPVEWGLRGAVGSGLVSALLLLKVLARPRVDAVTARIDVGLTAAVATVYFLGLCLHSVVAPGSAERAIVTVLFYVVVVAVVACAVALGAAGVWVAVRERQRIAAIAQVQAQIQRRREMSGLVRGFFFFFFFTCLICLILIDAMRCIAWTETLTPSPWLIIESFVYTTTPSKQQQLGSTGNLHHSSSKYEFTYDDASGVGGKGSPGIELQGTNNGYSGTNGYTGTNGNGYNGTNGYNGINGTSGTNGNGYSAGTTATYPQIDQQGAGPYHTAPPGQVP
jgi:hypothetical protein